MLYFSYMRLLMSVAECENELSLSIQMMIPMVVAIAFLLW